jgi:hypothetical protein
MSAVTTLPAPRIDLIEKAWVEHIDREYWRGEREPHPYVYAGSRRRCLRRTVLECTHPEWMPEFDADTKARMLRGDDRERDILTDLARVGRICEPGFRPISQQETVRIVDRNGRLVIKGKIDGKIQWATREIWPYEVKNWSPFLTEKLHTFADLYQNPWTWPGAHQLLAYLYATAQPHGLLILDRSGLPRLLEVNLEEHLEPMEAFLADATVCVDHIEAGTLPDFIQDAAECQRCPMLGSYCQPPSFSTGATIVVDEETIRNVDRWHETREAGEEHEELDKWMKKRFRGIDMALVGNSLLEGHWQRAKKYDVPPEDQQIIDGILAKHVRTEPHGKFFLKVTRL